MRFDCADSAETTVFREWGVLVAGIAGIIVNLPRDLRSFVRDGMAAFCDTEILMLAARVPAQERSGHR